LIKISKRIVIGGIAMSLVICSFTACGSKGKGAVSAVVEQPKGTVAVTLNYKERDSYYTNQFAIWIEDDKDHFVKTVYVTSFTANGGYEKREDALPIWVERSDIQAASSEAIDAISGPTPKSGKLMYIWNLTDEKGQAVAAGTYHFYVEATVYQKNRILYSGIINTNGPDTTVTADASYTTDMAKDEATVTGVAAIWKR
jgi:hypothetical protein